MAAHAFDVAAGAEGGAGAPISSAPTSGFSPQILIMLRSAGVKSSESALRTSGRLSVITATRSRIAHSNSLVPVSTVISVVILDSPILFLRVIARSGATKQSSFFLRRHGLLCRGACHRARIRATRWLLTMTIIAILRRS